MDHSIPNVDLVRPWRTAAFVATLIAAIELVILVVAAVVILGEPVANKLQTRRSSAQPTPAPKPQPSRTGKPALARAETSVIVLNGNGRGRRRCRRRDRACEGLPRERRRQRAADGLRAEHGHVPPRLRARGSPTREGRGHRRGGSARRDEAAPAMGAHLALIIGA